MLAAALCAPARAASPSPALPLLGRSPAEVESLLGQPGERLRGDDSHPIPPADKVLRFPGADPECPLTVGFSKDERTLYVQYGPRTDGSGLLREECQDVLKAQGCEFRRPESFERLFPAVRNGEVWADAQPLWVWLAGGKQRPFGGEPEYGAARAACVSKDGAVCAYYDFYWSTDWAPDGYVGYLTVVDADTFWGSVVDGLVRAVETPPDPAAAVPGATDYETAACLAVVPEVDAPEETEPAPSPLERLELALTESLANGCVSADVPEHATEVLIAHGQGDPLGMLAETAECDDEALAERADRVLWRLEAREACRKHRGLTGRAWATEAVGRGELGFLEMLLEAGADPDRPLPSPRITSMLNDEAWGLLQNVGVSPNRLPPPLHTAAMLNDTAATGILLAHGASINALDDPVAAGSALCAAMHANAHRAAFALIQAGADANIPDFFGRTPLDVACARHDAELIQLLLERGADPNARDARGRTSLHWLLSWAWWSGASGWPWGWGWGAWGAGWGWGWPGWQSVPEDAAAGGRLGDPTWFAAWPAAGPDERRAFLTGFQPWKRERDVPLALEWLWPSRESRPEFEYAAFVWGWAWPQAVDPRVSGPELLMVLIEAGADVNAADADGTTPLMLAAVWAPAPVDCCRLLLKAGADPNACPSAQPAWSDSSSGTALDLTAESANPDMAEPLFEDGAEPDTPSSAGPSWWRAYAGTALHLAAESANPDVAELLLENGADVNALDLRNRTPVYRAALAWGLAVSPAFDRGFPWLNARARAHAPVCRETTELLIAHGADLAGQSRVPVCLFQSSRYGPVQRLLADNGAAPAAALVANESGEWVTGVEEINRALLRPATEENVAEQLRRAEEHWAAHMSGTPEEPHESPVRPTPRPLPPVVYGGGAADTGPNVARADAGGVQPAPLEVAHAGLIGAPLADAALLYYLASATPPAEPAYNAHRFWRRAGREEGRILLDHPIPPAARALYAVPREGLAESLGLWDATILGVGADDRVVYVQASPEVMFGSTDESVRLAWLRNVGYEFARADGLGALFPAVYVAGQAPIIVRRWQNQANLIAILGKPEVVGHEGFVSGIERLVYTTADRRVYAFCDWRLHERYDPDGHPSCATVTDADTFWTWIIGELIRQLGEELPRSNEFGAMFDGWTYEQAVSLLAGEYAANCTYTSEWRALPLTRLAVAFEQALDNPAVSDRLVLRAAQALNAYGYTGLPRVLVLGTLHPSPVVAQRAARLLQEFQDAQAAATPRP